MSVVWELRKVVSEWREGVRAEERVWELKRLSETGKEENRSQLGPTWNSWRAGVMKIKSNRLDFHWVIHVSVKSTSGNFHERKPSPLGSSSINENRVLWAQFPWTKTEYFGLDFHERKPSPSNSIFKPTWTLYLPQPLAQWENRV